MRLVLAFSAAVALYFVFAGDVSAHEAGIAVVLALLAALRAEIVDRTTSRRFSFDLAEAAAFLRAAAGLPAAVIATTSVFTGAIKHGRPVAASRRLAFRTGEEDDPRQRARRAIALLCASLAPDGFVLRAEQDRNEVLVHDIAVPRARDRERLS